MPVVPVQPVCVQPRPTPPRLPDLAEDALDPEQLAAVRAPRGPVCVLAGAGTGKTRTITHRIAHLAGTGQVAPGQVLAVTFTTRAAGELRTRLRAIGVDGVQARTFHAAALRQLRYFWPRVVGDAPWQVVEHKLRLVAQAAGAAGAGTDVETLRDLAAEIEWAKATLVGPADYPAGAASAHRDPPCSAELVAGVYAGYERAKTAARQLDFDDLLLHTAAALEEHPEVATEFRDRYRCFVVDEYQDVTPLQQRVLAAWLGGRDDLTVVGDANQTIYSFTGASPEFLLDFPRRYPHAVLVRLERDYRSTPQVVSCANRLLDQAAGGSAAARLRLTGQRAAGPPPSFREYDDEPAEAAAVAGKIKDLVEDGTPAGEIAVLFRVNAQSQAYEQALSSVGVGYQVRGGQRYFERPEVRQAVHALRAATHRPDRDPGAAPPAALVPAVRAVLAANGMPAEPPPGGVQRQRWEALRELVGLAEELVAVAADTSLAAFVAELDTRAQAQHPPAARGVTMASLHAAKGLEWDAVFLVGLADGTLPIQHAQDNHAAIEEERRLLYVGVTRARRLLYLSWALARAPGGRPRRPSRFLRSIMPADAGPRPPARGRDRPRCRICGAGLSGAVALKLGRCPACPANLDQQLYQRLQDWRSERARQQRLPAFVVFTDATLTAIAERRPADLAALVAIPGIGAAKVQRYGAEVIELVRAGAAVE
jgi:DNA helicase-2/ATP-dependent DNA helicase PcrA